MFVEVKAIKPFSYQGVRKAGETFYMRRSNAKILEATGKLVIIEGTDTKSPTLPVQKVVATITKKVEAETVTDEVDDNVDDNVDDSDSDLDTVTASPEGSDVTAESDVSGEETLEAASADIVEQPATKTRTRKSKYA